MAPSSRRSTRRLVTLTSDLGWEYAAQMKAVLSRRIPPGHVVDLTHDLPRHETGEAAFVLRAMAEGFPAGTVHVAVVDPGVGGRRAPVVIECTEGSRLVGPDNGLLWPLAEALGFRAAFRISTDRRVPSRRVGTTFDGRDVFAPAAGRLAGGSSPSRMGPSMRPVRASLARAERHRNGALGRVMHVDRFGNAVTNVPSTWVPPGTDRIGVRTRLGRSAPRSVRWTTSYEELGVGRLGALGSSFGSVELAVARGRADRRLQLRVGASVSFTWSGNGRAASETVNISPPRRR